jgi:hypothetical protein
MCERIARHLSVVMFALVVVATASHVGAATTYIVVFKGSESDTGFEVGGSNLLNLNAALGAVTAAGGTVTADLTHQIGIAVAFSPSALFAEALRANPVVEDVFEDVAFSVATETGTPVDAIGSPAPGEDALEFLQWGLRDIRASDVHASQILGSPAVDVAMIDTGIDATHVDFIGSDGRSNVDFERARSFVRLDPDHQDAPATKEPDALAYVAGADSGLGSHGTFTAGLVAARKNGVGIVGVAPNVTLIPIRVSGAENLTFLSWLCEALTYAGDIQAEVVNMSLRLNHRIAPGGDDAWCGSDADQLAERVSLERAVRYLRKRGALPVAVAGNGGGDALGDDLAADDCDVLPAETPGVVVVGALRRSGTLPQYSNYGLGSVDLVAPAGVTAVPELCSYGTVSTNVGNSYFCTQGTSISAPFVSGVAALIVSQFGKPGSDGDIKMPVGAVEDLLYGSAIDIGASGEDLCYGLGRVDAYRAVTRDTSYQRDETVTSCMRYAPPPPSSCPGPQITDVTDDTVDVLLTGREREGLDIVSASFAVASDGEKLEITLTVKNLVLPAPPEDPAPLWAVYFDHLGVRYVVQAYAEDSGAVLYSAGPFTGNEAGGEARLVAPSPEVEGSFTAGANGTIVFRVPRSHVGYPVDGDRLTNLSAGTYLGMSPAVDRTTGADVEYTVGQVCDPAAL